jgi:hypothetical protein
MSDHFRPCVEPACCSKAIRFKVGREYVDLPNLGRCLGTHSPESERVH